MGVLGVRGDGSLEGCFGVDGVDRSILLIPRLSSSKSGSVKVLLDSLRDISSAGDPPVKSTFKITFSFWQGDRWLIFFPITKSQGSG